MKTNRGIIVSGGSLDAKNISVGQNAKIETNDIKIVAFV